MTVVELKEKILNKNTFKDFLVLQYEDNDFVCRQYIEAIAKNGGLTINRINSLAEISASALSLVFDFNAQLNVLYTDIFNEKADYINLENCIVVCNKTKDITAELPENCIVKIPALSDWNIKDYIQVVCPGLESDEVNWLYEATKHDIFKVNNEVSKIALFPAETQRWAFSELRFESGTDLCTTDIYDLVNALILNDKLTVLDYFKHINSVDVSPMGLVVLLSTKIMQILTLNFDLPIMEASSIGKGPAYYIRKDFAYCNKNSLLVKLAFLTKIDQDLKLGNLDFSEVQFINYIICNLLEM